MITVELEHFSLDRICDSGQCFRMRKLGDGHFSMVAGELPSPYQLMMEILEGSRYAKIRA